MELIWQVPVLALFRHKCEMLEPSMILLTHEQDSNSTCRSRTKAHKATGTVLRTKAHGGSTVQCDSSTSRACRNPTIDPKVKGGLLRTKAHGEARQDQQPQQPGVVAQHVPAPAALKTSASIPVSPLFSLWSLQCKDAATTQCHALKM